MSKLSDRRFRKDHFHKKAQKEGYAARAVFKLEEIDRKQPLFRAGMNVLVDPSLLIALDARVGDSLSLGFARFEIAGALESVPGDPGVSSVIGPRIFIADKNVEATKLLGFNKGVTVTAGLKTVFTTPAHGTAFDILGQGKADPGALEYALRLAATLAAARATARQ